MAASHVLFRNGSLGVDHATCDPRVIEKMRGNMVPKGLNWSTEQILRDKYPQERHAVLLPSGTLMYSRKPAVGAVEQQMNSLSLATGNVISFCRSNISLGSDNWLFLSKGTTLEMDHSNHFSHSFIACRATWYDANVLLSNSSIQLVNSTLELMHGSYLELWATSLELVNSSIVLAHGGEINFKCHSTTFSEGVIVSESLTALAANSAKVPQRGAPLGTADAEIDYLPSGDIDLD
ncbi:hypothetical protein PLESTF_001905200 [Pleodorina starrii]|nr:hypothetical protein PLESTM_001892000 [Pleodorina starrii]GLC77257.1 hypothetical protein PLESTF_001905200 [Pleodorina starrii]